MKIRNFKLVSGIYLLLSFTLINTVFSQDVFKLKSNLAGQHPRILFTQAEADARAELAKQYMSADWKYPAVNRK